ncbi:MAG: hypothetical protein LQ347_001717 [Umbilicaria vellea]|nr:MAG: hypothetical protein LQ347_001717 [Umbilicaria vellea]
MDLTEIKVIYQLVCTCNHFEITRWKRQELPLTSADLAGKELSLSIPLETKADRSRKLFDTVVHVKVGKDARIFVLHRGLLCDRSAYFRAAFEGRFREAEEHVLVLPEEDVEVFELFQFWLYSDKLFDTGESVADLSASLLISLYLFAEARCIPQLQNMAIDALILNIKATKKFPAGDVHRIYDNTTEASHLRRLLVDIGARVGELRRDWFNRGKDSLYHNTFLIDLVLALYDEKLKKSPQDFTQLRCNYHVHPDAEKCCVPQEWR